MPKKIEIYCPEEEEMRKKGIELLFDKLDKKTSQYINAIDNLHNLIEKSREEFYKQWKK